MMGTCRQSLHSCYSQHCIVFISVFIHICEALRYGVRRPSSFPDWPYCRQDTMTLSQFRGRILRKLHLKTACVTAARQGCPISKVPSNAAEKCSLLFTDLKGPPAGSFTAQRIQRSIARWIFSEMASGTAEAAVAANYIFNDKTM